MLKRNKKYKNLIWIILNICVIYFLILAKNVLIHKIVSCDVIGYEFISKYLINDYLTPIIKIITWCGGVNFLLLITFLLLILIKKKKIGIYSSVNLMLITSLNQILKVIFHRPRPTEYKMINAKGYSFPSGHSMVSMAFYGYLIYLISKNIKNKYLKWPLIIILIVLIFLIGLSRVYLGVHYISDVIAGFVISIAYLILFIHIIYK